MQTYVNEHLVQHKKETFVERVINKSYPPRHTMHLHKAIDTR